jgi:DNA-binding transcriptional LysR family regulator
MFIAQPTLSQQIRRLEEMVGAPPLQRGRDGVQLTEAGSVPLEESRAVLSRIDYGVSRARQAAGLTRPRLRFVVPPSVPEDLVIDVASRLRRTAAAAEVDVAWIEAPLDGEFAPVLQRQADAGLSWLTTASEAAAALLEVMSLGEFEPGVWLAVIRASHPNFGFTDPPFRRSLPMTLSFAASASRPTAVLTGPHHRIGDWPDPAEPYLAAESAGLVRVRIEGSPLAATADLVWGGDLPRQLQQVLFDTADSIVF